MIEKEPDPLFIFFVLCCFVLLLLLLRILLSVSADRPCGIARDTRAEPSGVRAGWKDCFLGKFVRWELGALLMGRIVWGLWEVEHVRIPASLAITGLGQSIGLRLPSFVGSDQFEFF